LTLSSDGTEAAAYEELVVGGSHFDYPQQTAVVVHWDSKE